MGFCGSWKNDGRRGTFEEDLQRWISHVRPVPEISPSEMFGGQGVDFLREVAFWNIKRSGSLRGFCATGAALRMTWLHFFAASAVL